MDIGTGQHPLAKWFARLAGWYNKLAPTRKHEETEEPSIGFADSYHGKAVPLETARRLVSIREDISIPDLEQVIPYKRARSLILHNPDHVIVLDCPCRSARPNPCLPLDVCLVVGEPFASLVHEHHPDRSRWITGDEAIAILKAEDERGHVHHAFFKDAMLGRFFAICNCCSCCCGAMNAHRTGTPMLASSGYRCKIQEGSCIGCGACADACPFHAITVQGQTAEVDPNLCMGCGVCVDRCDHGAISLDRDNSLPEPLELEELIRRIILRPRKAANIPPTKGPKTFPTKRALWKMP